MFNPNEDGIISVNAKLLCSACGTPFKGADTDDEVLTANSILTCSNCGHETDHETCVDESKKRFARDYAKDALKKAFKGLSGGAITIKF